MSFAGLFSVSAASGFTRKQVLCGGGASQVSTSGNFARDPRLLCRASRAAVFALNLGLLAACAQLPDGRVVSTGPDIMDRVRSVDLLPRYPQQGAATGQSGVGASAKPQVYPAVTIPAAQAVDPPPTPRREGSE